MINEAPIYFNGPDDEVNVIDPYKEFKIEEVEELLAPEENRVESKPIVLDSTKEGNLNIGEIIERTGESLTNEATDLASLDEEVIEGIEERMRREANIRKDHFFDHNGVKHSKDPSLNFDNLSKIVGGVDSVFGVLCVDGLEDLDFNISFSTEMLKDLLNNGLFSFAECFFEKATTMGMNRVVQDAVIAAGINVISSDSPNSVSWIKDNLDPGVTKVLGDDFLYSVVEKYERPPSQDSLEGELSRLEDSLYDIKDDWFYYNNSVTKTADNRRRLDTIKKASDSAVDVFLSNEKYYESIAVANAYEKTNTLDNYKFSTSSAI